MEGNLDSLIKVTAWLIASMTYARFASSSIGPGKLRLLSLLPVILLLPCLPWRFTSVSLRGTAAFFLSWLGVFKLLLLSFGAGPLSPSLPLPTFIAISSLPVKIQTDHPKPNSTNPSLVPFCIKLALLFLLSPAYHYKSQIHPWAVLVVYSLYIYLILDFILSITKFSVGTLLGLTLEPQVDNPFQSDSLQDFWGRRWNLMVTSILRPSVYDPVRLRSGTGAGVIATFVVSGLMHEILFYYMTVERPTGEVTLFFVAQGLSTLAEVKAKKAGWWGRTHPAVAVPMTLGFVAATAFWLFFPPLLRARVDEQGMGEVAEMLTLVEEGVRALLKRLIE